MQWTSLILDPITISAPDHDTASFTLNIKGLPLFDRIGSLVILPPSAFHVEDPEQVTHLLQVCLVAPAILKARPTLMHLALVAATSVRSFLEKPATVPLNVLPASRIHAIFTTAPRCYHFPACCPQLLPALDVQLEDCLEQARKRYSIPIRAGSPDPRAVAIRNGRNLVHCYFVSGDQALLLNVAQSPGLIVGKQICRAQLAFEYNTCQVKRNLTAAQKQTGLLREWLAPAHIAQADAHASRKRPAPSAPVVTLAEEIGDSMQQVRTASSACSFFNLTCVPIFFDDFGSLVEHLNALKMAPRLPDPVAGSNANYFFSEAPFPVLNSTFSDAGLAWHADACLAPAGSVHLSPTPNFSRGTQFPSQPYPRFEVLLRPGLSVQELYQNSLLQARMLYHRQVFGPLAFTLVRVDVHMHPLVAPSYIYLSLVLTMLTALTMLPVTRPHLMFALASQSTRSFGTLFLRIALNLPPVGPSMLAPLHPVYAAMPDT